MRSLRHIKFIQLLIDLGADINQTDANNCTALVVTCLYSDHFHNMAIDLLIKNGAKIDLESSNGYNALMIAVRSPYGCIKSKTQTLKLLLDA